MGDIRSISEIKIFVDHFYEKIQKDDLLGPVFALRIAERDWPQHLEKMYRFWNTVLFFQKDYRGNPFAKHIGLHVQNDHFRRWVYLFRETIDDHFSGPKAEETKQRAESIAMVFNARLSGASNEVH